MQIEFRVALTTEAEPILREETAATSQRRCGDGACPYVSLCSSMSTGDWDLFLGPLEWARAETGGAD